MSIAVYPRLGELLAANGMTVAELEQQIEQRYGLTIDGNSLLRLTQAQPVHQADVEAAGAAAAILGVGLDDLFDVQAIPVSGAREGTAADLSAAQSRRLTDLFDERSRRGLSSAEQQELVSLVGEYGRRRHEAWLREYANRQGIPVEQARQDVQAQLDEALAWWRTIEADPRKRRAIEARARKHRGRGVVAVG